MWSPGCSGVCTVPCGRSDLTCFDSNTCSGPLQACINDECGCREIADSETIDIKDYTNYSCENGVITIRIDKCAVKHLNYDLTKLFIGGSTSSVTGQGDYRCYGDLDLDHEGVEYIWQIDLTENLDVCSTDYFFDGTSFTYQNSLQGMLDTGSSSSYLAVREELFMGLSCTIPAVDLIRKYTNSEDSMNFATTVEQFDLNVYTDEKFQTRISASKITAVPNHIYVNAIMASATADTRLVMKTCFYSESESVDDTSNVSYILDESCPNNDVNIFQNGDNYAATFTAKTHSFGDGIRSVYLHCYAEFCDSSNETCEPSCNRRKRRDTGARPGAWKTAGPFKFVTPTLCRYDVQQVCGRNAECNELSNGIQCVCRNGYEPHPYDSFGCVVSETSNESSTADLLVIGGGRLIQTRKTSFGLSRK